MRSAHLPYVVEAVNGCESRYLVGVSLGQIFEILFLSLRNDSRVLHVTLFNAFIQQSVPRAIEEFALI